MEEIRVLIADDEKEIRDLVKKYLEREGIRSIRRSMERKPFACSRAINII